MKRNILRFLCMTVAFALALCSLTALSGCKSDKETEEKVDITELGSGENSFYALIFDREGNRTIYEIYTDEIMVGSALLEQNLIETKDLENGGYYVCTLDGITADLEEDGEYWSVSLEGKNPTSDILSVDIICGSTYVFEINSIK